MSSFDLTTNPLLVVPEGWMLQIAEVNQDGPRLRFIGPFNGAYVDVQGEPNCDPEVVLERAIGMMHDEAVRLTPFGTGSRLYARKQAEFAQVSGYLSQRRMAARREHDAPFLRRDEEPPRFDTTTIR